MNQRKVYCDDDQELSYDERRSSIDISPIDADPGRFVRTLDNISQLFDKLSKIDESLTGERSIVSEESTRTDRNGESVQERLRKRMDRIATGITGDSVPGALRMMSRSKSDSCAVDSARIEAFRASDANERCKFLESELVQALDRIRSINQGKAETSRRISDRADSASKQASIAMAELQLAKEEIKNLLRLNSGLREKNGELKDMTESQQAEIEKLKSRMLTLRQDKAKKEALVEAVSRKRLIEAQSARGSVFEIESSMGKLRERMKLAQSDTSRLQKEKESLSDQLEELKMHHSATSTAYESCVKENETFRSRIQELEETVENKKVELQQSFADYDANTKNQIVSDQVVTNLLSQLADAKAEASAARSETRNALSQLDNLRLKCVAALNREKRHRQDLEGMQQSTLVRSGENPNELIQSLRDKLQVSSGIYLKRIQKLQGTVNDLNEKVFDLERRQLKRAPVLIRPGNSKNSSCCSSSLSSRTTQRAFIEPETEDEIRERPVPEKCLTVN